MTSTLTWAARSLALGIAVSGFAQASIAQSASSAASMDMPASGAKMTKMKKPMKARVTGGPGYVSESAATAASGSSAPMVPMKKKARVTGGPGGTAGTPDTTTGK